MNKKRLSERDICTKYITPALEKAGWDIATQIREEFPLTRGRVIVRGKLHTRAKHKRADYVLFYKPNIPVAVIEAKDNNHSVGDGMQQGLVYADMLQVPFAFSSNGDGFLFHNKIATDGILERELSLNEFPSAETLWQCWTAHRGLDERQNTLITQDYHSDGSDKTPRYYQISAINQTIVGPSDVSILNTAYKKLYPEDDISILIQDAFDRGFIKNLLKRNEIFATYPDKHFFALFDFDKAYDDWRELGGEHQITQISRGLCRKLDGKNAHTFLLPVPENALKAQVWDETNPIEKIKPHPHYCIEHCFWGEASLDGWFRTDANNGQIRFKGDKHKVKFAKDIVPSLNVACFEIFRPIFEFIKSKCQAGEARP